MILVEDLGVRDRASSSRRDRWGAFWCPSCGSVVERMMRNGARDLSCGCSRYAFSGDSNATHGLTRNGQMHPLYAVANAMIERCHNPNSDGYERYGGRGITVCAEWRRDRAAFVSWALANGYRPGLQVDRENNDGPYSPANCRFVTRKVNCRNRRSTVLSAEVVVAMRADFATGSFTQKAIAQKYGLSTSQTHRVLSGKSW